MAITSLRCPNCGADVDFSGDVIGHCPYCDSQLHFDDILVDKAELEKLKAENHGFERLEAGKNYYRKKMKHWKTITTVIMVLMAVLTIAGFLVVSFGSVNIGAPLVLLGFAVFLFASPVLGALWPYYDETTGRTSGGTARTFSRIFAVYGISLVVFVLSIIIAGITAVEMGYESKKDESSSISAGSDNFDMTADSWNKVVFSDDDDDISDYYELQCPDSIWETDKDSADTAMMSEYHKAHLRPVTEQMTIRTTTSEKLKELSNDELLGAEAYFKDRFGIEAAAMQGYEYHMVYTAKSKDTGETEDHDEFVCVVKLKGNGIKVIPEDTSYLRKMLEDDND